ncbi:uncharacterized protein LOC130726968 isoform X2 [Lotus japonicus]|uniref:uncharacterized protein LOC130726968 isoform X2 n=1 Tax=Lotus japonicus TaxID=34305 RepID=UPI00258A6836|nr:uncharacterized protein LOC130726968 isoform X2 [Lotus japonicus]
MEAAVSKLDPITEKLEEGAVYEISNFLIVQNTGSQRYTRHSFRIILHTSTRIVPAKDDRIPLHGLSFFHIQNIMLVGDKFGYLVDVMGVLSAASRVKLLIKGNRIYKMMVIDIMDLTGKCSCVLVGDIVESISEYLSKDWVNRPTIGLRYVDVRKVDGKVKINCIPYVSKIYINHVYEEDWITGDRFIGLESDIPVEYICSPDLSFDIKDDMVGSNSMRTVAELLTVKQRGVAVVKACINAFINDCPWSYNSCWCHMELQMENGAYRCNRCYRDIGKTVRRYKIQLEVFDGYDNTIFVLNDAQANQCVGIQCEDLLNLNENAVPGRYPLILQEKLLSKELLFKVRTGAGTTYYGEQTFEVLAICDDVGVISNFSRSEAFLTPVKAKFCPPFTQFEEICDGHDTEDNGVAKLKETVHCGSSNIGVIHSLGCLSDSTHSSINQVIVHRPLKRKLMAEFQDSENGCGQLLQYVDQCGGSKLVEEYKSFSKGNCSGIQPIPSDCKSLEDDVEHVKGQSCKSQNCKLIE